MDLYLAIPPNDLYRAQAIRAFFQAQEQEPLLDAPGMGGCHVLRYRVPCVVELAVSCVSNLLREGFQVVDDTPLRVAAIPWG